MNNSNNFDMKQSIAKRLFGVSVLSLLTGGAMAQNAGFTFHVEDLEPIERSFQHSSSYQIANTVVKYNSADYRNGVIKSSIDGDSLISFGTHSFYKGMINAYASHRGIVLSPDVIWLLISQGFAAQFEALTPSFNKVRELIEDIGGQLDATATAVESLDQEIAGKFNI